MVAPRDILGMNARSLLYIKKYNSQKAVAIADSKLKTKKFLQARGIRVPKLIATFKAVTDITEARLKKLPADIVLKPDNSSGGSGIVVLTEKRPYGWITVSGKRFTYKAMAEHLQNIVQGAFTANGYSDIALIEKRIITHSKLQAITHKGLPDIRIIVFNLVPVLAMLRLPTAASDGKANLHSGGIGAGIDISKGDLTYLVQNDRLVHDVPGIGTLAGFTIPYWEEILKMAVQSQYITNIGYLGVDIALDRRGPILLEVNARPGLMVQVANLVPLRKRLRRVEGLKVKSVQRGITIAKALFGRKLDKDIKMLSGKSIVGNKEYITIHLPGGPRQFQAKINPRLAENYIDSELAKTLLEAHPSLETENGSLKMRYQLLDKKSQSIFNPLEMDSSAFDLIIGKRELKNVLIDPYKYETDELPVLHDDGAAIQRPTRLKLTKKQLISQWRETDKKLARIEKVLTQHFSLVPLNVPEEKEKFIAKGGNYNPQFVYKEHDELIKALQDDLHKIPIAHDDVRGILFSRKQEELHLKLELYGSCGKDAEKFTELSEQIYARPTQENSIKAHELYARFQKQRKNFASTTPMTADQVSAHIHEQFQKYGLENWSVVQREHGVRISVGKSKKRQMYLRSGARFAKEDMQRLMAHEVETHVLRLENGLAQPYRMLASGTPNYLETEEGLAIYNQSLKIDTKSVQFYTPALTYLKTVELIPLSFSDSMDSTILRALFRKGINHDEHLKSAFLKIYRVKRGIGDTSQAGGCTKDLVYFTGLQKVQYFIKHGGDIMQLYKGKIDVDSISIISQMEELKDPLYLPPYYS